MEINPGVWHNSVKLSITSFFEVVDWERNLQCLSRLFTKFQNKRQSTCDSLTVDNVIISSGRFHSEIYKDFFKLSFGVEPEIEATNDSEDAYSEDLCLTVPHFDFWD